MTVTNDASAADREWLINQIAHALRNPIFAASVQTEALHLRLGDPEAVAKTANALQGQLQRLSAAIDEMLLFGRPYRLQPEETAVAELIESTAVRYRNGERREAAAVEIDPIDGALSGRWDRTAVVVILERMLDNAVEHTESPHEVWIGARKTGDASVAFEIRDRGAGIAPELLDRVLLPFFPQHSGRPGLGLAIADKFARLLGGRIEIESTEGDGTTARCVLPVRCDA